MQAYDDKCAEKAIRRAADVTGADIARREKRSGRLRVKLLMPLAVCFCCAILAGTLLPFMLRGTVTSGGAGGRRSRDVTFAELQAAVPDISLPDASGFASVAVKLFGEADDPLCAQIALNGTADDAAARVTLTIVLKNGYADAVGSQFDDLPLTAAVDGRAVAYRFDGTARVAYAHFVVQGRDCYLACGAARADAILTTIAAIY